MKAAADKTMKELLISPDGKKELVSVIAIYGSNAAGKSNVIDALLLMREMVCGNFAKPLKGDELPYEPFAFVDGQTEPTAFEIIYYYDGIKYAYGFSFDKDRIISEYLYHWPNSREALVFSSEKNQYEFRESIQEQLTLAGRTSENRLNLTSSNEWNCAQTEKAYACINTLNEHLKYLESNKRCGRSYAMVCSFHIFFIFHFLFAENQKKLLSRFCVVT